MANIATIGLKRHVFAVSALIVGSTIPASADLQLCNRMSYAVEAALALEDTGSAATRGWYRLDPGQCRVVLQGAFDPEHVLVHARAMPVYGVSPLPQSGHSDLCVGQGNFLIASARVCRAGQRPVRFTQIKPAVTEKGASANLAEEAGYDEEQARLAGVQRLLVMTGYDANPIDGVPGPKTDAALAQFLKDRQLAADASKGEGFFDLLIDAAQKPEGVGFAWCNETNFPVMAALGLDEKGVVVTRGWYRVEPGKCVRPDMRGQAKRLYSYAEAVDGDSRAIMRNGKALAWGGTTPLCTREVKFELSAQKNCEANGLATSGFAVVDLTGSTGNTLRLKEP